MKNGATSQGEPGVGGGRRAREKGEARRGGEERDGEAEAAVLSSSQSWYERESQPAIHRLIDTNHDSQTHGGERERESLREVEFPRSDPPRPHPVPDQASML